MATADDQRKALWGIYYHSMLRRGPGESVAVCPDASKQIVALAPPSLDQAVETVLEGVKGEDSRHTALRNRRAFYKLATGGFVRGPGSLRLARRTGASGASGPWAKFDPDDLSENVERLAVLVNVDPERLEGLQGAEAAAVLDEMPSFSNGCPITDRHCVGCYDGLDQTTTVTAGARVQRTPRQLSHALDPRGWEACGDFFDCTKRGHFDTGSLEFAPIDPDPWTIGESAPEPYELGERVISGNATFENVLWIESFRVSDAQVRAVYDLIYGGPMTLEGLGPIPGAITTDKGYCEATADGPEHSRVTMVKHIHFRDLTLGGGDQEYGLDLGEVLNYWAAPMLCLWLEDVTQMNICCDDPVPKSCP